MLTSGKNDERSATQRKTNSSSERWVNKNKLRDRRDMSLNSFLARKIKTNKKNNNAVPLI
jgi:hypothetical protein